MNKIVKHHLEEEVIRLRTQGFGYIAISREIKEKHDIKLSFMSVKRFLDSNNVIISELISKKEEYKERFAKIQLDTMDSFIDTILKIDESIDSHEDNWRAHVEFLRLKMRTIDMAFKLNKSVDPKEVKQKIDILSIKKAMDEEILRQLKGSEVRDGKLIVNNPALIEHYLKMKGIIE